MDARIEGTIPEGLASRFHAIAAEESKETNRLLAEAIAAFVAEHEWKKAVQIGLDAVAAGRTVSHEEVMEEMERLLCHPGAGLDPYQTQT